MKGIKLYILNQIGSCYKAGTGQDSFIYIDGKKLTYGCYGNPYDKGWSKTIDLPVSFNARKPAAIVREKGDFIPVTKVEKGEIGCVGDQYFVTIIGDYVHINNKAQDSGNPPHWFSWDVERGDRTMSEILTSIEKKQEKGVFINA